MKLLVKASFLLLGMASTLSAAQRPNVVVIVADDLGYGDVGFNGCKEIPTPHLDALASGGIVFTSGYASHPYCSPSRAGLLTGRYQQRFGHECNPEPDPDSSIGLPASETTLATALASAGYVTGAIGKWHLGDSREYWPDRRGFDEWFGFSGGGLSYWGALGKKDPSLGVHRGDTPVPPQELSYLTDDFSREAASFVQRHAEEPFFLYLAYNAPHAPDQATRRHLQKTEHIEYGGRAVYGAMVAGMDEGIGQLTDKLKELGIFDNTLIFFYSDNGGRKEHAVNYPFRGHKGMLFEGGIRVPFCVSWPSVIKSQGRYERPISALDIFPTALAAAKVDGRREIPTDGVDLIPFLTDQKESRPHHRLYWRYACGDGKFGYAIREGDKKLVYSVYKGKPLLFDLSVDPWEREDLAETQPDEVTRLTKLCDQWQTELIAPGWPDAHGRNVALEEQTRQEYVDRASKGDRSEE